MDKYTFIEQAKDKYGESFNYSHIPEFITRVPCSIICNKHGKLEMVPRDHLRSKHGCPQCASEKVRKPYVLTNTEMLGKAKEKYKDKFDYTNVDYHTPRGVAVKIKCPIHGDISMSIKNHLHSKTGCPDCGVSNIGKTSIKYTDIKVIETMFTNVHSNKYKYLEYNSDTRIIKIECPVHGIISQSLNSHISGRGCKKCGYDKFRLTAEKFLELSKEKHPVGYMYDLSDITTVNQWILIKHSCGHIYRGRISNHLSGQGCIKCKTSLGEKRIQRFLKHNNIQYESQYPIDESRLRYDIFIPEINMLIEYDGKQHFEPVDFFGGVKMFERRKELDKIKNNIAKKRGYVLIRISYIEEDKLEKILSRAIERFFRYRVNNKFYRTFEEVIAVLKLPDSTKVTEISSYRTSSVLSSPK